MTSHEELEIRIMSDGEEQSSRENSTNQENNKLDGERTKEQINTTLLGMSADTSSEIVDEFEKEA